MALKRNREDKGVESQVMNNCMKLVVLYKPAVRVFKCKICDRQFESFQALGGHTAGHNTKSTEPLKNQKTHRCSTCGEVFGCGQALGGHMRKHWSKPTTSEELTSFDLTIIRADVAEEKEGLKEKKARRSLDLDLDLLAKVEEKNLKHIRHDDDLVKKESNLNLELKLSLQHYEDLTLKGGNSNLDGKRSHIRESKLEYFEFI